MNVRKWHHSEIRIAINDESQSSIAKNLRWDELLYYTFIIHSAGERIFKIGEHLAKLRAKSLSVSYPIRLHIYICSQRDYRAPVRCLPALHYRCLLYVPVFITGIFGRRISLPPKNLQFIPNGCQIVCSESFFRLGQWITNISRKLSFNGQKVLCLKCTKIRLAGA